MTILLDEYLRPSDLPAFIETLRREVLILASEMEKENARKRPADRPHQDPPPEE